MILNKDYKFRDDLVKKPEDTVPIELTVDPFTGIVFRFDRVEIREEEDTARLRFEYTLLETLDFVETKLRQDKAFVHYVGLVLNAMLLEYADADANRKVDSEELVEDGNVHAQGSASP